MAEGAAVLAAACLLATPALAQDNFDAGKSGAQLYASDCAICHKSAQALNKSGGGLFGLESFLREHYTSSRESAAAIAAYLNSVGNSPAAAERRGAVKKKGKKKDEAKPESQEGKDARPAEKKPEEKPADKPTDKKGEKKDSGQTVHPKSASAAAALDG
jgi:cytochrome c